VLAQTGLELARKRYRTLPGGQITIFCPAPLRKIFRFPRRANHRYKLAPSCSDRGALAIVTDVEQDAVDADGALTNAPEADGEAVWS